MVRGYLKKRQTTIRGRYTAEGEGRRKIDSTSSCESRKREGGRVREGGREGWFNLLEVLGSGRWSSKILEVSSPLDAILILIRLFVISLLLIWPKARACLLGLHNAFYFPLYPTPALRPYAPFQRFFLPSSSTSDVYLIKMISGWKRSLRRFIPYHTSLPASPSPLRYQREIHKQPHPTIFKHQ